MLRSVHIRYMTQEVKLPHCATELGRHCQKSLHLFELERVIMEHSMPTSSKARTYGCKFLELVRSTRSLLASNCTSKQIKAFLLPSVWQSQPPNQIILHIETLTSSPEKSKYELMTLSIIRFQNEDTCGSISNLSSTRLRSAQSLVKARLFYRSN